MPGVDLAAEGRTAPSRSETSAPRQRKCVPRARLAGLSQRADDAGNVGSNFAERVVSNVNRMDYGCNLLFNLMSSKAAQAAAV
jgi:hypothetical protein